MKLNLIYYLTAALLGGMHALEPGHGKTVVAAYLVGSRGTKLDAIFLGIIVTLTHTFTVILMALVAKYASTRVDLTEQALHGYMGIFAGLLILVVGGWMLIQRIRGRDAFHFHSHPHGNPHGHSHHHDDHAHAHAHIADHHHNHSHDGHDHVHIHHDHAHSHHHDHTHHLHDHDGAGHHHDHHHDNGHDHHHHHDLPNRRSSYWQLFLLGVSGGAVPCPAAIAILIAAIGVGKIGEGLTYILLFSLGLAAVLITIGLVVVSAGRVASRLLDSRRFAQKISIASAALIVLIGLVTLYGSIAHFL